MSINKKEEVMRFYKWLWTIKIAVNLVIIIAVVVFILFFVGDK